MATFVLPTDLGARETLAAYRDRGGYDGLERALGMDATAILEELTASGLRGRGGAAFPTAQKWRTALETGRTPVLVVNGAEGEPGSFKDRTVMARAPHAVLEGVLIAAHTLKAETVRLYVNDQFPDAVSSLSIAVEEATNAGYMGPGGRVPVTVDLVPETHVYIAGEETALIQVLMGQPAVPWHKPPYPTERGYKGQPTVVNNVDTLAQVAVVLRIGGDAYRTASPMLFSVSGDVAAPGVYEMPLGTRLCDLVTAAGGMRDGRPFRGVLPGGYSTPLLDASAWTLPLDYETVRAAGSGLGCSIIVLSDARPLSAVAHEVLEFFAIESCGRCPTCVRGTRTLADTLSDWAAAGNDAVPSPDQAHALLDQANRLRHKGICSFLDTVAHFAARFAELQVSSATSTKP